MLSLQLCPKLLHCDDALLSTVLLGKCSERQIISSLRNHLTIKCDVQKYIRKKVTDSLKSFLIIFA